MSESFIEKLRKGMTIRYLVDNLGIERDSKSENDLERAKCLFREQHLSPKEYRRRVRVAAEFIGVKMDRGKFNL